MCDWTIRIATERDIESVLVLWQAAGGSPSATDTCEDILRLLVLDRGSLLVAEVDHVLIGSLIAAWDGWRGSFYRLAVHPDRRRLGLATALVIEGERRLRGLGAVRLTAIVAEDSPAALGFWERAGYLRQSQRVRFVRHAERSSTLGVRTHDV